MSNSLTVIARLHWILVSEIIQLHQLKNNSKQVIIQLAVNCNNHAITSVSSVPKEKCYHDDDYDDDDSDARSCEENEAEPKKPKRTRTAFSTQQLDQLELLFTTTHYPDVFTREETAKRLNIKEDRIQVQNTGTVKPVYNGDPWDQQKWLLYRGDLIIQSGFYAISLNRTRLGLTT